MPARATIVIDLGFGDCGKGTVVDYLARLTHAHTVVRFNGGPQAGHNVVTAEGQHHTFSQIGSGTLASPTIATFLSRYMLIEPYALVREVAHLQSIGAGKIWDRLLIDARCVVITPAHQAANRLRELARGDNNHGTCGQGVGEATADHLNRPDLTIHASDFTDAKTLREKLQAITAHKLEQVASLLPLLPHHDSAAADMDTLSNLRWIDVAVDIYAALADACCILSPQEAAAIFHQSGEVIFEGAQGVLLDQDFGFHPHTTWSRATSTNAEQLLQDAGITQPPRRIGVLRSYFTRHGPGPFVTESENLRKLLPEPHNEDAGPQGRFRVGVFDAVAARYAVEVGRIDEIAITHMDRLHLLPDHLCTVYQTAENAPLKLSPNSTQDLQQRALTTQSLRRCHPIFTTVNCKSADAFAQAVQCQVETPVRLLSFGPLASDKRAFNQPAL